VAADLINETLLQDSTFRLYVIPQASGKWTLKTKLPMDKWFQSIEVQLGPSEALKKAIAWETTLLEMVMSPDRQLDTTTSASTTTNTTTSTTTGFTQLRGGILLLEERLSVATPQGQLMVIFLLVSG
jgi:hypothetical protein